MLTDEDASYVPYKTRHSALCPLCQAPHHYVEVHHPACNDPGYWEVKCSVCERQFFIADLHDVYDSYGNALQIIARHEGQFAGDPSKRATEIAVHNVELNAPRWQYDYATCPLYECPCGAPLDGPANLKLEAKLGDIVNTYFNLLNHSLKGHLKPAELAVVRLPLECPCGASHEATYYTQFKVDLGKVPTKGSDFLLADVSNAQLAETLEGIRSKTQAMDLLEKLIVRWNLYCDQIIVASPFVGHQYLKPAQQLEIWNWLLSTLDPQRAIFITRRASWNSYKKVMQDAGLPVEELARFGLESKVIASGKSKQEFHAKFYAGITAEWSEVYSGSANLVRGPYLENTSFRRMPREAFDRKYISRMNLKTPLISAVPPKNPRKMDIFPEYHQ